MNIDPQAFTSLNRIIHEPARALILSVLRTAEKADFLFLLKTTGLSKGNLSAHLSRLQEAGYVSIEKTYRGKLPLTLVAITPLGAAEFETYRRQIKDLMDDRPPADPPARS